MASQKSRRSSSRSNSNNNARGGGDDDGDGDIVNNINREQHFAFEIETPNDFVWEITVRSFGFFLVPPNFFDRQHRTFSRPLRVTNVMLKKNNRKNKSNSTNSNKQKNVRNNSAATVVAEKEEDFAVFDTLVEHQQHSNTLRVSTYLLGGSKGDFHQYHNLDEFDRHEVQSQLKQQIVRMFRLDGDIQPFHKLFDDAR